MALFRNHARSLRHYGIAIVWIAACAIPAYGQATLFSNRQSFEAAIPNRVNIDFASVLPFGKASLTFTPPNPIEPTFSGVTFRRVPFNEGNLSVQTAPLGSPYQGWEGNPAVLQYINPPLPSASPSFMISLPPGTLAVGMNFYTVQTNVLPAPPNPVNVFTGNLQITLSTGQTFILPSLDKPTLAFAGFISTTPITSITILPPLASETARAGGDVELANFTYSTEPSPVLACPAATATANAPYSSAFTATGGALPYMSFSVSGGALPPGLNIGAAGNVTGTPGLVGTFTFTGSVADNFGRVGTADCSIVVAPPPPITLNVVPVPSSNGTQVLLTWNFGGGTIDGFVILRKAATLSGTFQQVTSEPAAGSGSQLCPPAVFTSGLLAAQSRCLLDTVPEPWSTFTYQVQVSGGVQGVPTDPSNKATVYQVRKTPGAGIDATFTPAVSHTLQEAAQSLGFDHFNWISMVAHDPQCYTSVFSSQLHAYNSNPPAGTVPGVGPAQLAPHLDPPIGGYFEYGLYPPTTNIGPSDGLPYYWDEQGQWILFPADGLNPAFNLQGTAAGGIQNVSDTAKFKDTPFNSCLAGGGPPSSSTEYWGFVTTLVGVRNSIGNVGGLGGTQAVIFIPLASFAWNTTNNGSAGGANGVRSLNLDPPQTPGSGGVFNLVDLDTQNLPLNLRQILIQSGGQDVSNAPKVDKDAPATTAFLSGPQGSGGVYTGTVTVTLFATDVDGPADIASTSYKLDGGSSVSYTGPFTVSASGAHTIVFSSIDQAQNAETPQPSISFTIGASTPLSITGPATLPPGAVGTLYSSAQFTATGGSGTGYTWTETGALPNGLNFSAGGLLSGTPLAGSQGTYNPQFKVTDSANNTATVSRSFTITSAGSPPPVITSISPNPVLAAVGVQTIFINGQNFKSGAGLKVHLTSGSIQTDIIGAQVTFLSSTQLSIQADVGSNTATWTATVINPDNQNSNALAFAVQTAQVTTFALPQFTSGGGWYTALYFANTTNFVAHVQVNFYRNDGTPLLVPLLAQFGTVSAQGIDVNPHSTVILEAPNSSSTNQEGWAEVALPTGVTGYAVFRQTVSGRPDQEAVVPLTPESSLTADLTYDDILFTTSVALLNPTNQTVTVTINTFDDTGAPNGTAQQVLNPRSKQAIALGSIPGLSGIAGKRGRAVFSAANGAVSVLGLRFGGAAFTSIPVFHRLATPETRTISFALPQFVFGGSWYTALYLSNTTNATASVPVSFIANTGAPLSAPLAGIGSVTSQLVSLAPGATAILEAPLTAPQGEGWVEATTPPGVTGYAVFRQTVAGRHDQEAVVPLTPESSQTADLVYDDTAFTTAVAFLNPSDQQETVTITVFSASGVQIGSAQVALAAHSKVSTVLKDLPGLSNVSGNRGWASFSVSNGEVSVLGLRFGGVAFTSIPVRHR